MTKVLQFKHYTEEYKKFIFPKNDTADSIEGIEVTVDLTKKEFVVRKVNLIDYNSDDNWLPYLDNTFPSSLLREFLNSL